MTQDPRDNRRYPVSGELLQDFAPPNADWLPGHRGIDLAASTGTPVFVPVSGVVSFVGRETEETEIRRKRESKSCEEKETGSFR